MMSSDAAKRVVALSTQLCASSINSSNTTTHSDTETEDGGRAAYIKVGSVVMRIHKPDAPHKVPLGFVQALQIHSSAAAETTSRQQQCLQTIKFVMQKLQLEQDVFLLGSPGVLRRRIALAICELLQLECEFVQLSADTTESSIKQRREIASGTSRFVDGAAVRAAIHGRVLVLEGMEKAERNVLPVLNNLLENREMQLDDGRMLVAPQRYNQLLADGEYTQEEMDAQVGWGLACLIVRTFERRGVAGWRCHPFVANTQRQQTKDFLSGCGRRSGGLTGGGLNRCPGFVLFFLSRSVGAGASPSGLPHPRAWATGAAAPWPHAGSPSALEVPSQSCRAELGY